MTAGAGVADAATCRPMGQSCSASKRCCQRLPCDAISRRCLGLETARGCGSNDALCRTGFICRANMCVVALRTIGQTCQNRGVRNRRCETGLVCSSRPCLGLLNATGCDGDNALCDGDLVCRIDTCLPIGVLDDTCHEDDDCGDTLVCTAGSCAPDCGAAVCGDDGCGGSCGTCADGETCDDGTCGCGAGPACSDGSACVTGVRVCGGGPACGNGESCVEGVRKCGDGPSCYATRSSTCSEGAGKCGAAAQCTFDEFCNAGGFCAPLTCFKKGGPGEGSHFCLTRLDGTVYRICDIAPFGPSSIEGSCPYCECITDDDCVPMKGETNYCYHGRGDLGNFDKWSDIDYLVEGYGECLHFKTDAICI